MLSLLHTSLIMCSARYLLFINSLSVRIITSSYVQDVRYADFARGKIGEKKISIRKKLLEHFLGYQ